METLFEKRGKKMMKRNERWERIMGEETRLNRSCCYVCDIKMGVVLK